MAVIFFCVAAPSRILPVRKRSVLWCPDFPLALPFGVDKRQTGRLARLMFSAAKVIKKV